MSVKKIIGIVFPILLIAVLTVSLCFTASATEAGEIRSALGKTAAVELLSGLGLTVLLIAVTVAVGFIFGVLLFLWYYVSGKRFAAFLKKFADIFSLVPITSWLVICYYIIFGGLETGYLAAFFGLSFNFSIAVFGVLATCLCEISPGQIEAAVTMGYDKMLLLRRILLPQLFPKFFSVIETDIIVHIQNTSVVGFIKLNDFQAVADRLSSEGTASFIPLILTALVYIILSYLVIALAKFINRRFFPEEISEEAAIKRLKKRGVSL